MSQDALVPAAPVATWSLGARKSAPTEPHPGQGIADQTRHLRATRCRQCRAPVLTGLNDVVCAFMVAIDPAPISAIGEVLATLAGRQTMTLDLSTGLHLTRRGGHQITARPAGTRGIDVYVEHLCGAAPLPSLPTAFPPRTTATATDTCPF